MAMSRLDNCLSLSSLCGDFCGDLLSLLLVSLLPGSRKEERCLTSREGGAIATTAASASATLSSMVGATASFATDSSFETLW
jgi:hypothetical protein